VRLLSPASINLGAGGCVDACVRNPLDRSYTPNLLALSSGEDGGSGAVVADLVQCFPIRENKSRNKVAVGEPSAGSLNVKQKRRCALNE